MCTKIIKPEPFRKQFLAKVVGLWTPHGEDCNTIGTKSLLQQIRAGRFAPVRG